MLEQYEDVLTVTDLQELLGIGGTPPMPCCSQGHYLRSVLERSGGFLRMPFCITWGNGKSMNPNYDNTLRAYLLWGYYSCRLFISGRYFTS